MLKNILLALAALFAGVTCLAADLTPMSPEDTQKATQEIISACAEIKSLKADFTQERSNSMLSETMISKGKMYYQEGKLRWEYTSPAAFLFVSDGANTVLKSGDGIQKIDASSNRIYKRIAGMIRDSLTGEALAGTDDFKVKMFSDEGKYVAELAPQKRDLRQMYKSVRMHFDKDLKVVQVDLIENNGQTVIHICNAQYNNGINPEYFSVSQ
ncbi:MAG: outer membrane lipoprotein carrier protein LolA [Bacteroidales bacterium]|nr:outer membrane lipoprotein carrier protein LolA [Bacteroidales bacterium]MDY6001518.1 outer membrane lipoprotein carrier protein LolA [Candidatus Cryptobacteroides sp.]